MTTRSPANGETPAHLVVADAQRLARDIARGAKDLEKKLSDLAGSAEKLSGAPVGRKSDSMPVYTRATTLARASLELLALAGKCLGLCSGTELFETGRQSGAAATREPGR